MIERFLLKKCLGFDSVELNFEKGLNVFTGESGAGKSVLFEAMLGVFAFSKTEAALVEADVRADLEFSKYGILAEEINSFKQLREKTVRYFINSQSVSKKNLQGLLKNKILHLSSKEADEMKSENMIKMLDEVCKNDDSHFAILLEDFRKKFKEYEKKKNELEKIQEEEKKINELREFAEFELEKINAVNPKIDEDKELLNFKKDLSKKEKIQDLLNQANLIFEYEQTVSEVLSLSGIDGAFFDACMNDLRAYFEEINTKISDLENVNVDELLDRIEQISSLKTRFLSIENALEVREKRIKELEHYKNLSFEKDELEQKCLLANEEILSLAKKISIQREKGLKKLEDVLNLYLKKLYLGSAKIIILQKEISEDGQDELQVILQDTKLNNLSSGEFNRLRLAFIASSNELINLDGGVLFLDEIDANLSGKESMSVANILKEISKKYQIFAISHLPQLTSVANSHFLVYKDHSTSNVKQLDYDGKINELARMLSGEKVHKEAIKLASSLLKS